MIWIVHGFHLGEVAHDSVIYLSIYLCIYQNDDGDSHESWVTNDRGNLPLHSAASFRAPKEVTEALLDAYPEAASLTNNYGNLALHFTAWKKGPLDVEELLLKVFPEGRCIGSSMNEEGWMGICTSLFSTIFLFVMDV